MKHNYEESATAINLTTERLIIRQLTVNDAESAADFVTRNRDFHAAYEPIRPDQYFTTEYWIARVSVYYAERRASHFIELHVLNRDAPTRVIGRITFSSLHRGPLQACYLGYAMDENERGQGYMTEALRRAIDYMFVVENFHRIMANYMPANKASEAVLQKLGFEKEGYARDYLMIAGTWQDHVLTSLINSDWRETERKL